jgi:hypothetical protein
MPDTTTSNLGLTKPEIGASADTWGNKLNTDLDLVDALFAANGTGTSVGINVGAGKVAAVAGTLNVTGTVSGGVVAPLASPTFTGTVGLPSTTSIGAVSSTEIGYLDGVTSNLQTQLNAKLAITAAASTYAPLAGPTFTGTVTLPSTTSIGGVSAAEIVYLDGVTSNVQTQLDGKAGLASPAFTGTPTAPTATTGTNTTQVATTAFVQQAAFNNTLPSQTGNAGKYVTTDGTNASWGTITIPAQVYPSAGIAVSTGTGWGTSLTTPLGVPNGGIGASTLAANNVLLGNGTSAVQVVAPGATGNVLTSNGTTWTSAAVTPSTYELISTAVASNTTNVDFINLSSNYSEYVIVCSEWYTTNVNTVWLLTSSDNGSTFASSNGNYIGNIINGQAASVTSSALSTSFPNLMIGATVDYGHYMTIRMVNAGLAKNFAFEATAGNYISDGVQRRIVGFRKSTTAVNAVRLSSGTSNLNGTFRLYGVKAA